MCHSSGSREEIVMDNFSASLRVSKPAVTGQNGVVAAQHRRAAEVGARVLAQGGDAVDAAIATSFALGVLEPWMSGIGGGGAMVLYRAAEKRYSVIDFGMRAPASLDVADYPATGEGVASDLFPWARVRDDRNIHGPYSIAVPGVVDGMRLAHERYATLPWGELVAPAIQLADEGLLVDWMTTQNIASAAADLQRYPAARELYLVNGLPPVPTWSARGEVRLPQKTLADTLRHLAGAGPRDFYEGQLAARIVGEIRSLGGKLSVDDLRGYRARESEPRMIDYRGARIAATPELTAGPTLAHTFKLLGNRMQPGAAPGPETYEAYAKALQEAYEFRLTRMGDVDGARAPDCTTHFCIADRHGNIASVTQTLLSIFGSRVSLRDTGVLMNNGIMWFDPEPGRPNSLGAGKRCLTNYCPIIAEHGARRFAIGASGGRRILPAVAQLLSFMVDFGDDPETAMHRPRIDASEGPLVIGDSALEPAVHDALGAKFEYVRQHRITMPMKFACPSVVMHSAGASTGVTEIGVVWADAVRA
ncbi:MAG: gamma-glutamyltransferase [Betaproteobacteria bacterium]|nr:gamma-glutamyltransferase [Betaproteobacteria bacterium]